MRKIVITLVMLGWLSACSFTRATPAPVINVTTPAARNVPAKPHLAPPTHAAVGVGSAETTVTKIDNDEDGQVVQVPAKAAIQKKAASAVVSPAAASSSAGLTWLTPTKGKIIQAYSIATKGVDVSGVEGQPIVAAAAGKVVYSGSGLKGYGNLIIIKHQDNYLTAYSHNKVNLVKEGELVKRGQKIAELGKSDSDKPMLHFELRQSGKPLNPSKIFQPS